MLDFIYIPNRFVLNAIAIIIRDGIEMGNDVESYVSAHLGCPQATGIWIFMTGVINGEGESHYHWHPDYVCIHILSRGQGTVRTPTEERRLQSGDMFTLWPGVEIEYYQNPSDPWLVHFIHLLGPHAVPFGKECGFDETRCFVQPFSPVEVIQDFKAVFDILKKGDYGDAYQSLAHLYRIIGHCRDQKKVKTSQEGSFENIVQRSQMLIEAELDSGLNVNDLAAMMRVGRTTLFKAFLQVLGISPIDYLTRCRIKRAKELLNEQQYEVGQIARMTGYKDVRYFQKRFKMQENMSVSEWIKENKRLGTAT